MSIQPPDFLRGRPKASQLAPGVLHQIDHRLLLRQHSAGLKTCHITFMTESTLTLSEMLREQGAIYSILGFELTACECCFITKAASLTACARERAICNGITLLDDCSLLAA